MRLAVIGAKGMLGSSLVALCKARGIEVNAATKQNVDITQPETIQSLITSYQPTHLVNCAAYTNVDAAEQDSAAYLINAQGAEYLAQAATRNGVKFIHVSTDFVFDGTKDLPYFEQDSCDPVNAYGQSKWEGEKKVLAACPNACVIRTSWLFGSEGKNFFSSLVQWLRTKESLEVIDDQWGRLTYAKDLAQGILDLLDHEGIFHFANAGKTSRFEVAQFMREELLRRKISCAHVYPVKKERFPLPAKRPTFSVLATEKVVQATGRHPRSWQESVMEFLHEAL